MKEGCRAERVTGMHWCVNHASRWPSGERYCEAFLARKRAFSQR